MKMVLVFDTDDREGCKSSLKIMKQLAQDYNFEGIMSNHDDPKFGKIEFIKTLRKFMRESVKHMQDEEDNQVKDIDDMANLRNAKRFADRIFLGER